jgi:transposase-like protein/predicted phosphodiesterase
MQCVKCGSTHVVKRGKYTTSSKIMQRYACKSCNSSFATEFSNIDDVDSILAEVQSVSTKLAKDKQKLQDIQRIERKSFREQARILNALEEYNKELINVIKNNDMSKSTFKYVENSDNPIGLIHVTDAHFNELIDIDCNKYDFKVAAKRLKKLANRSIQDFHNNNVTTIVVALGGDLINSDRLLSEKMMCATNRSNATFLAIDLLNQFIMDLNQSGFNVSIVSVSGNESRKGDTWYSDDILASDNYDMVIFNILKLMHENSQGIEFIKSNPVEAVINVKGNNILLIHGNHIKNGNTQRQINELKGRYADKGVIIDYVLMGHYHSAIISDLYARGASLCGANAYSEKQLNLSSRASQNIFIVGEDYIDGKRIDLQYTDSKRDGTYNINSKLEAYNAKSLDKSIPDQTIVRVVI